MTESFPYMTPKEHFAQLKVGDIWELSLAMQDTSMRKVRLLLILEVPRYHKSMKTWSMTDNEAFWINDLDFQFGIMRRVGSLDE